MTAYKASVWLVTMFCNVAWLIAIPTVSFFAPHLLQAGMATTLDGAVGMAFDEIIGLSFPALR